MPIKNKHFFIATGLSLVLVGLIVLTLINYFSKDSTPETELSQTPRISTLDIVWGSANAPLTMIVYSSYQCKFCTLFFEKTFPDLKRKYVDTKQVKVVLKLINLREIPEMMQAIQASVCVNQFADFGKFHELLLSNYEVVYSQEFKILLDDFIAANPDIAQCLIQHNNYAYVRRNNNEFREYNFTGTPTFVIGNDVYSGFRKAEWFEEIFQKQLSNATKTITPKE
jgi:protein-disulfide isomerase